MGSDNSVLLSVGWSLLGVHFLIAIIL